MVLADPTDNKLAGVVCIQPFTPGHDKIRFILLVIQREAIQQLLNRRICQSKIPMQCSLALTRCSLELTR